MRAAEMSGADRFVHATEFLDSAIHLRDANGLRSAQLDASIANTQATLALCELQALTVPSMVTRNGLLRIRQVPAWRKVLGL